MKKKIKNVEKKQPKFRAFGTFALVIFNFLIGAILAYTFYLLWNMAVDGIENTGRWIGLRVFLFLLFFVMVILTSMAFTTKGIGYIMILSPLVIYFLTDYLFETSLRYSPIYYEWIILISGALALTVLLIRTVSGQKTSLEKESDGFIQGMKERKYVSAILFFFAGVILLSNILFAEIDLSDTTSWVLTILFLLPFLVIAIIQGPTDSMNAQKAQENFIYRHSIDRAFFIVGVMAVVFVIFYPVIWNILKPDFRALFELKTWLLVSWLAAIGIPLLINMLMEYFGGYSKILKKGESARKAYATKGSMAAKAFAIQADEDQKELGESILLELYRRSKKLSPNEVIFIVFAIILAIYGLVSLLVQKSAYALILVVFMLGLGGLLVLREHLAKQRSQMEQLSEYTAIKADGNDEEIQKSLWGRGHYTIAQMGNALLLVAATFFIYTFFMYVKPPFRFIDFIGFFGFGILFIITASRIGMTRRIYTAQNPDLTDFNPTVPIVLVFLTIYLFFRPKSIIDPIVVNILFIIGLTMLGLAFIFNSYLWEIVGEKKGHYSLKDRIWMFNLNFLMLFALAFLIGYPVITLYSTASFIYAICSVSLVYAIFMGTNALIYRSLRGIIDAVVVFAISLTFWLLQDHFSTFWSWFMIGVILLCVCEMQTENQLIVIKGDKENLPHAVSKIKDGQRSDRPKKNTKFVPVRINTSNRK